MQKVAIVTDSTATIPKELVEEYNISVVPQVLIWSGETLQDGIDITPGEFYTRLRNAKVMPSTSQATPASFLEIFKRLLEEDCEILAVLISEKLSGTIASAVQAREMLMGVTIEIIDSQTAAMAMGFQVLEAAKAAKEGANLAECKAIAEKAREHTGVIFAVDTLEFLHRGGRIGGGARFLGTALNLKPILEIMGGKVEAVDRVRTRKKSLDRVVDLICERTANRDPVHLASLHANAPEDAKYLLEQADSKLRAKQTLFTEVSPVVGAHAGPGTVGLAFMAGV